MSKRFSPENEIKSAVDIMYLLLFERANIVKSGDYSNSNDRHIKELCSSLLWKHSEAYGKYNGCRYWSEGALESRRKNNKLVTNARVYGDDALRHEHVIPRNDLISYLFLMDSVTHEKVRKVLSELNIGVVITVGEDRRLSKKGDIKDLWKRYREADIQVFFESKPMVF